MGAPAKLALYAALVVAVFSGAALLGGAVDPDGADAGGTHAEAEEKEGGHGGAEEEGGHGGAEAGAALPGLALAQDGFRLEMEDDRAARGDGRRVAFRIVDDEGSIVRAFDVAHEKRMHLIVVRRDMTQFQHVHPTMDETGTWSTDVDLPAAGTYRVFADFTKDGEQHTLGADLHVPGEFTPRAVPAASTTTRDDRGLEVRLRRKGSRVAFDVVRDGVVVNDRLEPYLGARGHLVTLRAGDLAYVHTHADGDLLAFETELPSAGTYRLWVQFQLDGRVHTAAFTQEVTTS